MNGELRPGPGEWEFKGDARWRQSWNSGPNSQERVFKCSLPRQLMAVRGRSRGTFERENVPWWTALSGP